MHELLYDNNHDIPQAEALTITKVANHGIITTDTCNGARKTARLLEAAIRVKCLEKGMNEDEICIYLFDCHNHLRNVQIGTMNRDLSTNSSDLMQENFDNIDSRLRVSTKFDMVLLAVDQKILYTVIIQKETV